MATRTNAATPAAAMDHDNNLSLWIMGSPSEAFSRDYTQIPFWFDRTCMIREAWASVSTVQPDWSEPGLWQRSLLSEIS